MTSISPPPSHLLKMKLITVWNGRMPYGGVVTTTTAVIGSNIITVIDSYQELKLRIDGSTCTDIFLAGAVAMVNRNFGAPLIMTFHSYGTRT